MDAGQGPIAKAIPNGRRPAEVGAGRTSSSVEAQPKPSAAGNRANRITLAGPATLAGAVDRVFSAAELLDSRGRQVVCFELYGQVAYLRRVSR